MARWLKVVKQAEDRYILLDEDSNHLARILNVEGWKLYILQRPQQYRCYANGYFILDSNDHYRTFPSLEATIEYAQELLGVPEDIEAVG